MKAPRKILVGPFEFSLRFVASDDSLRPDCAGICNKKDLEIVLDNSLNGQMTVNVLIHEILHAIFYAQGIDVSDEQEEDLVNRIANGAHQVLKDNPKSLDFILSTLNGE